MRRTRPAKNSGNRLLRLRFAENLEQPQQRCSRTQNQIKDVRRKQNSDIAFHHLPEGTSDVNELTALNYGILEKRDQEQNSPMQAFWTKKE